MAETENVSRETIADGGGDMVESEPSKEAAAAGTPSAEETASLDAYKRLNDAQSALIDDLTQKIVSLNEQIAKLVNGGANVSDGINQPLPPEPESPMTQPDYVSLAELDFVTKDMHG